MATCKKCGYPIDETPEIIDGETYHKKCIIGKGNPNPQIFALLENSFKSLTRHSGKTYLFPDIPPKKSAKAIESYANEVIESQIIALHDSSVFGGAKTGVLITAAGLYFKGFSSQPISFMFKDINNVEMKYNERKNKKGKIESWPIIRVTTKDTKILFDEESSSIDLIKFYDFLQGVVKLKRKDQINETDKFIIIEDLPNNVKVNYVKIIINMVYEDDKIIDQKELSEIQILMTQLDFSPELRMLVREYICDPNVKFHDLLTTLDDNAPKGSQFSIHISLLKDLIRVYRRTKPNNDSINQSSYISNFAKVNGITDEQIKVIEDACRYDELVLDKNSTEKTITKNAQDLAAKAGAVGLPLSAVYLSGSVVGLSAAGITSGLASLGIGGIFGLSSMVTGVGTVVLLGVGAYKGVKWFSGLCSKDESISKREFMIQEIIRINQKTISNLAEDINFFAKKLIEVTRETEINRLMIDKLNKELTIFCNAVSELKAKENILENSTNEAY